MVVNYEAPQSAEIYVHRVGRTARAGRKGVALTLAAEPDRKVVKAVVTSAKTQNAKVVSRKIEREEAEKWQKQIDDMADEIKEIIIEEREERQLAQAEMQVKRGENIIEHEAEIKARPKRTWFETEHEKKKSKQAGRDELNGLREKLKKKGGGRLSNKDKKRLDAKEIRSEGQQWQRGKTAAERNGPNGQADKRRRAKKGGAKKGKTGKGKK